jgi:hypothetical protein
MKANKTEKITTKEEHLKLKLVVKSLDLCIEESVNNQSFNANQCKIKENINVIFDQLKHNEELLHDAA